MLLANQIHAEWVSANHWASSEDQFENLSKHLLIDVIRNLEHQTMVIWNVEEQNQLKIHLEKQFKIK